MVTRGGARPSLPAPRAAATVHSRPDPGKCTPGHQGRQFVIVKSCGSATVTKDGVTVAKEIELENRFENMGAKMVREVAWKTSDLAGDGATTGTSLARRTEGDKQELPARQ